MASMAFASLLALAYSNRKLNINKKIIKIIHLLFERIPQNSKVSQKGPSESIFQNEHRQTAILKVHSIFPHGAFTSWGCQRNGKIMSHVLLWTLHILGSPAAVIPTSATGPKRRLNVLGQMDVFEWRTVGEATLASQAQLVSNQQKHPGRHLQQPRQMLDYHKCE